MREAGLEEQAAGTETRAWERGVKLWGEPLERPSGARAAAGR